jgi:hypothetical protein
MHPLKISAFLLLSIVIGGGSTNGGREKFPSSIKRHCLYLQACFGYKVANCITINNLGEVSEMTDTVQIRKLISVMGNNKNFSYYRNTDTPLDIRTSYTYNFNESIITLCFDARGNMERNDSTFKTNENVRQVLYDDGRLEFWRDINDSVYKGTHYSIQGVVTNQDTQLPIAGAIVKKVGSDGSADSVKTNTDGSYSFDSKMVKSVTSYILWVTAIEQGYNEPHKVAISTVCIHDMKHVFTQNFELQKKK